ncbi:MAG: hypothetical protein ACLQK4_07590 [Acidimicrobiales bacterium]|jgi:hypothetical protein
MQSNLKTKLLGATGGALVLAMAAGGVSYASTGSGAATPATPVAASKTVTATQIDRVLWRQEVRRVLRHTVHAELVVDTRHGFKTIDVDRGVVQSDVSNVLTIKRPDGPTVTATITGSTHFYGLSATQIGSGDRAIVIQTSGNALVVASKAPSSTSTSGS